MLLPPTESGGLSPRSLDVPVARGVAWATPVDVAGFGCLLGYGTLAWLARQPGEPSLAVFFGIVAWAALITFGLYFCYVREPDRHASRGSGSLYVAVRFSRLPVGRMILWAVLFRVCGLLGGPFLEDDYHRYLWDGYRFATDGSPYGHAPEEFFGDANVPATFRRVLDRINHPEVATIYGPVTQLLFLLAYLACPASVLAIALPLVLVDLACIALLLRLAPPPAVLLYAWCPLVVKEIAFTAHPDGLGACLLLAAVVLTRQRRLHAAAILLALAGGTKVFALLLAPFVLANGRLPHWLCFAAVLAAVRIPPALLGGSEVATLALFAQEWKFNAALFDVLAAALPDFHARIAAGVLFLAFWCWRLGKRQRASAGQEVPPTIPRGDWILGVLLLLSPVINPWYLLWLLPFAAVHRSAWAWTASVAALLSYTTGLHLEDLDLAPYEQPAWVRPVEFGAILLAAAWDIARSRRARALASLRPGGADRELDHMEAAAHEPGGHH